MARSQQSQPSQFEARIRGLNLTDEEDIALCRAFISIGEDEIVGNLQKWAGMGRRVEEAYYQLLPNVYRRPINTLQHRWTKINADVQVFSGILGHCEQARASGHNDIDVMNEAKQEFKQETGRKWRFQHCWEIMKDVPKWSLSSVRLNNMHGYNEVFGEGSNFSPCTPVSRREDLNINDNIVDFEASIPRPPGRKQKIAEKRRMAVDPEYKKLDLERKERLNTANDNFQAFIGIKQRELELKERELAMLTEKNAREEEKNAREEEDRHNYTDTSKFTPAMLAYHQERGNELAEARRARHNARGY